MSRGFGIAGLQLYTSDPTIVNSSATPYVMTDHNRAPIQISYDRIENSSRMANGTLRRYITANKKKISVSWNTVPATSGYNFTADGNLGAAWLKSFFEENVYNPIWVKLTYADEAWRFASNSASTAPDWQNTTFNRTAQNNAIPNTFDIASVSFTAFSSGVSTVSINTITPHNFPVGSEVMISGVNQLLNGTWVVSASTSATTFKFIYATSGNASATFKINSYVQSGTSASFNTDSTEFLQVNDNIVVSNSQNNLGSSINGTWVVTAKSSQTQFTASWSGTSQTANGQYGTATMKTSSALSTTAINTLTPLAVGPIIASDIIKVFITNFTYNITKRLTLTDYVDMNIEFTEI